MLSSTVISDPLLFGCGLWAAGTPPSKDLPGTTSDRSRTRKEDSVGATLSKLSAPDLRRPNGTENRGMRAAGQEDPYQKKLTQKPPVRSGLGGAAVFFLPRCCRQPDCRSGERGVEFLERDTMSRRCREGSTSGSVTSSRGFQRQGETSASCMTVRARNQLVCCCLQGCRLRWASPITPSSSPSSSPAWGEKSRGQKASNAEVGKRGGWRMVMVISSRERPRNQMLNRSPPLPALDRSRCAGGHESSAASQRC